MKTYQEVAQRYIDLLTSKGIEAIESSEKPLELYHILWMLEEVRYDLLSSETKCHRWLGYCQGVLCVHGVISVAEERTNTRNIFKGE